MTDSTFMTWLRKEETASKLALLSAYEHRDWLVNVEGTRLRSKYMELVGDFEQTVIEEEIECELLRKKKELIQAAINRREPIDEKAIDAQLEEDRDKMIEEAQIDTEGMVPYGAAESENDEKMREIYREIVKNFHPGVNTEMTQAQKELFEKAQEAYRNRDLAALELIYDMLISTLGDSIELECVMGELQFVQAQDGELTEDWLLVSRVYDSFEATLEEISVREKTVHYRQQTEDTMKKIGKIKDVMPFAAKEMLDDPQKVEEYKRSLALRLQNATLERESRKREIEEMMKGARVNG